MNLSAAPVLCSLEAKIDSYSVKKTIVYYNVTLRLLNASLREPWTVSKRFSSFDELHKQLSSSFSDVPTRPKKTFFRMKTPSELMQRKKDLEVFINKLLMNKELLSSIPVRKFFDIDKYVPKFRAIIFKEALDYDVLRFIYSEEDNVLTLVQELPLEDSTDKCLIRTFKFEKELAGEDAVNYNEILQAGVPDAVTCITYKSTLKAFACGTDKGMIYALKMEDNINLAAPSHSEVVTAICFEDIEGYIISAGADKSIAGTSFDNKILYSTKLGNHPLNWLTFNSNKSLVIASNTCGEIFLCDVKNVKLVLTTYLSLSEASPLKGFISTPINLFICILPNEVLWYKNSFLQEGKVLGRWKSEADITSWDYSEKEETLLLATKKGEIIFLHLPSEEIKAILPCYTQPINHLQILQNSGYMITAAKNSLLCIGKFS